MKSNFVKPSKSFIRMAGLLAVLSTVCRPDAAAKEVAKTDSADYVADEIVVSSTRTDEKLKNIPRKVEVITSKDIEALDPDNATELLQKTAGVDVIEYPGVLSGVSMRGFVPNYGSYLNPQYVTYLLDGRPLGTYNLASVDMNMIERVEVIKGPSSALYGSKGMGGTINFITKKSRGPIKGTASLGYGSFETFEGNAAVGGSISDRFDFDIGFRYFNQGEDYKVGKNTLISNPDPQILERDIDTMHNSTYSTNSGMMRVGYRLNDNFRVDLRGAFFNAPSVHTPGSIWGYYGEGMKDVYRKTADLSLTGTAGRHSIKFMPYWSKDESNNLKQTEATQNKPSKIYPYYLGDFEEYGFQLQDVIALGNHRITGGLDYDNQTYKTRRYSAPDVAQRPYSADSRTSDFGLFTQAALSFLDNRLIVTPGVRFDATTFGLLDTPLVPNVNTEKEHDGFFSPSLAFQYSFVPELKVHSSIGRAFVAPSGLQKAGEYVDSFGRTVRGNPDLEPETSRTWDVGLTWSDTKKGVRADVTYYDTDFKDFITQVQRTDGSTTYMTYVNAGSAKIRGLEFELSYDFGALADYRYSLRCFVNYTHQFENDVTMGGVTSPMKYVRDGLGSFGIEYDDFRLLSARLSGRYLGTSYEDNYYRSYGRLPNVLVIKNEPALVFDATVGIKINAQNRVDLMVKNLLDENYAEKTGYNMPGRWYGMKYIVTF
ncbi:TonB-dependent receptor plug domain-containing protein [Chlorobaculum tepidum]|nr:TonB-dependent receptor [Chlorobaculum tepidum]